MKAHNLRFACFCIGLISLSAVAAAYVAQHRFNMQPCPWCILQRLIFIALGLLGCLAAAVQSVKTQRWLSALMVPVSASGVAAALWQHFVATKSNSCAFTLADQILNKVNLAAHWPNMFEITASCNEAAVDLFGLPFEVWSLALFASLGVWSLTNALRRH